MTRTRLLTREAASIGDVENKLRSYFEAQQHGSTAYGSHLTQLWSVASSRVLGGKLVRPRLFLNMFAALGDPAAIRGDATSDVRQDAANIATALELLHYSFLLHDDVIDGDLLRRGTENFIGILAKDARAGSQARIDTDTATSSVHWARSCGILMGDLLLADVHQLFARLRAAHDTRERLLECLSHAIRDSVAGEVVDVGMSDGVLQHDLATVLEMSGRKTATYTFELPLRAAAALADSSMEVEQLLARLGQHLGLAFQLQDDLLSVFGDPELHGKDSLSDLREGKETAVIAYARTTDTWPAIEALFGSRELRERHASDIRDLLVSCEADSFVRSLIDEQMRSFRALLEQADGSGSCETSRPASHAVLPEPALLVLRSLADELEGRDS